MPPSEDAALRGFVVRLLGWAPERAGPVERHGCCGGAGLDCSFSAKDRDWICRYSASSLHGSRRRRCWSSRSARRDGRLVLDEATAPRRNTRRVGVVDDVVSNGGDLLDAKERAELAQEDLAASFAEEEAGQLVDLADASRRKPTQAAASRRKR